MLAASGKSSNSTATEADTDDGILTLMPLTDAPGDT
jgi:hypothetical protein